MGATQTRASPSRVSGYSISTRGDSYSSNDSYCARKPLFECCRRVITSCSFRSVEWIHQSHDEKSVGCRSRERISSKTASSSGQASVHCWGCLMVVRERRAIAPSLEWPWELLFWVAP